MGQRIVQRDVPAGGRADQVRLPHLKLFQQRMQVFYG
jgi:hypothetical protein